MKAFKGKFVENLNSEFIYLLCLENVVLLNIGGSVCSKTNSFSHYTQVF